MSDQFMIGNLGPVTRDQFQRILSEPDRSRRPRIDYKQRDADVEMGGAHDDINFYFVDPLADEALLDQLEAVALQQLGQIATLRAQAVQRRESS